MKKKKFKKILENIDSIVTNQIFAYKAENTVGNAYINKEKLAELGATTVNDILKSVVKNALKKGFNLEKHTNTVLVIGPAYGAINYASIVAQAIEKQTKGKVKAIASRTELDRTNDKLHVIPDKLMEIYKMADEIIIIEDIVNAGSTIIQVRDIVKEKISADIKISAFSLVDRGTNNTNKKLAIKSFYPFLKVDMKVYNLTTEEGINFINNCGYKMNTSLGKGKGFVEKYGEGPYSIEQF
jgi:orotate phosphoribosyltransferase